MNAIRVPMRTKVSEISSSDFGTVQRQSSMKSIKPATGQQPRQSLQHRSSAKSLQKRAVVKPETSHSRSKSMPDQNLSASVSRAPPLPVSISQTPLKTARSQPSLKATKSQQSLPSIPSQPPLQATQSQHSLQAKINDQPVSISQARPTFQSASSSSSGSNSPRLPIQHPPPMHSTGTSAGRTAAVTLPTNVPATVPTVTRTVSSSSTQQSKAKSEGGLNLVLDPSRFSFTYKGFRNSRGSG
jgi:hypothetical protein